MTRGKEGDREDRIDGKIEASRSSKTWSVLTMRDPATRDTGDLPRRGDVRSSERGTILIITTIILILIITLAVDAKFIAQIEWEATTNADVDFMLEVALRGGYQVAEAYLRQDLEDGPETDHFYEEWANPEGIEKTFDPSQHGGSDYSAQGSDKGGDDESSAPKIKIFIEDEDRKYPLPLLLKGADAMKDRRKEGFANLIHYYRANTGRQVELSVANQMAEAIIAFISREELDTGFEPTARSATGSGTLLTPADLALIPTIDESMIYDAIDEDGRIAKGLMHFVTVWTDLQINVNTAPEAVLRGIIRPKEENIGHDIWAEREAKGEGQREYENEMLERYGENWRRSSDREERETTEEEESESAGYWEALDDIKDDVDSFQESQLNDVRLYMNVKSRTFSIWVEAEMNGIKRHRRWVVRREGARILPIISELVAYPYFRDQTEAERAEAEESDW